MINTKKRNGFSLIELIVVMTIIVVITVVGMVSFTAANQKARDSRRTSDLEKVRIALEVYKQQNGTYPSGVSWVVLGATYLVPNYLSQMPNDPKSDRVYSYSGSQYSYCLGAKYEVNGGSGSCPSGSLSCGSVGNCDYIVNNP